MENEKLVIYDSIIEIIKKEGGHIKLTELIIYKDVVLNFTDIKINNDVKYTYNGNFYSGKLSNIISPVLTDIFNLIKENKFI